MPRAGSPVIAITSPASLYGCPPPNLAAVSAAADISEEMAVIASFIYGLASARQALRHPYFKDMQSAELPCRDRYREPFSSDSIWNTAIGSHAVFAPALLYPPGREPTQFHNDQDFFLLQDAQAEAVEWVDQGDWGADDHCKRTGQVVASIRLPRAFTTASDCAAGHCKSPANQPNNNAMGVLLADNVTLVQMQPAYRCGPGAPLFARFGNRTDGCPQRFPNVTSILGDGALGSHGGSGLSGVGGTIRVGELTSAEPIRHALKLELQHQWYYGERPLQNASAFNGGRRQYLWPATGSDSGSDKAPGGLYGGTDPHVAPGALLAVPAAVAASLKMATQPGAKVLQALRDYGGYIVDDTGAGNSAAICMEAAVNGEMRQHFGYAMTYPHGVSSPNPLYSDLLSIFRALHAVVNNGPDTVGGGGVPRMPTKPPICLH